MSPSQAAKEIVESSATKVLVGFVAMVAIPIGLWIFYQAETDLHQHGESLARISTSLDDLKAGQVDLKASVDSRIGHIVDVSAEQARELAALKQAVDDNARTTLPRRISGN